MIVIGEFELLGLFCILSRGNLLLESWGTTFLPDWQPTVLKIKVNPQLNAPWLLICPWYSYHMGEKSWSEQFWHFQACGWDNEEKVFCYIVKLYTKWSYGLKKNSPLLLMTSKKIYRWEDSESVESLQMSRQKPEISSKMTLTLIFW